MRNSRYRRSGAERRQFSTRITFKERRCGHDRRRVRDRRTGLDRRNPMSQRGWFPLGRRLASGEITVINLPETSMTKTVDTYKSTRPETKSGHKDFTWHIPIHANKAFHGLPQFSKIIQLSTASAALTNAQPFHESASRTVSATTNDSIVFSRSSSVDDRSS